MIDITWILLCVLWWTQFCSSRISSSSTAADIQPEWLRNRLLFPQHSYCRLPTAHTFHWWRRCSGKQGWLERRAERSTRSRLLHTLDASWCWPAETMYYYSTRSAAKRHLSVNGQNRLLKVKYHYFIFHATIFFKIVSGIKRVFECLNFKQRSRKRS